MITKLTFDQICEAVHGAYDTCKSITSGQNAHYIPYLANIDSDLFGISLCLPDGRIISVGDTDYRFGIESVSKVCTAILALQQAGAQTVLNEIGADATGLPFNSIMAILLENDRPTTPLVNAGAITACSLVEPKGDAEAKWQAIFDHMAALMGSKPVLIDELYRSESETNFNNRAILWLLKEYGRIYDDPDMSLDLYTRQCSLGVTAEQLAIAAATIADDGVNPLTKQRVFDAPLAPKVVSLMSAVGFYEHSGDWLYLTGLPAKTGVGGAIIGVMPGLFGVCAFAPPLDDAGNSVKAQAALRCLMHRLGLNVFSNMHFDIE